MAGVLISPDVRSRRIDVQIGRYIQMNEPGVALLIDADPGKDAHIHRISEQMNSFFVTHSDVYRHSQPMRSYEIFLFLGRMSWAAVARSDNKWELADSAQRLQSIEQLVRDFGPGRVAFTAFASELAAREVPICQFSQH